MKRSGREEEEEHNLTDVTNHFDLDAHMIDFLARWANHVNFSLNVFISGVNRKLLGSSTRHLHEPFLSVLDAIQGDKHRWVCRERGK